MKNKCIRLLKIVRKNFLTFKRKSDAANKYAVPKNIKFIGLETKAN
jgi:hypothetical protein